MLTTLQDDNSEWQQIMAAGNMTLCDDCGPPFYPQFPRAAWKAIQGAIILSVCH